MRDARAANAKNVPQFLRGRPIRARLLANVRCQRQGLQPKHSDCSAREPLHVGKWHLLHSEYLLSPAVDWGNFLVEFSAAVQASLPLTKVACLKVMCRALRLVHRYRNDDPQRSICQPLARDSYRLVYPLPSPSEFHCPLNRTSLAVVLKFSRLSYYHAVRQVFQQSLPTPNPQPASLQTCPRSRFGA